MLEVRRKEEILEARPGSNCGKCNTNLFLHAGTVRMLLSARSEGLWGVFSGNLQQKVTLGSRWCNPEEVHMLPMIEAPLTSIWLMANLSLPHTCSENSNHVPLLAQRLGNSGRVRERSILDEISSS